MRLSKLALVAAALLLTCPPGSRAEDAEEAASPPDAVVDVLRLIEDKPRSREEISARFEAIGAWVDQVDEGETELGEWSFVRGIALYQLRRYDDAADAVFAQLESSDGGFPTDELDDHLGRVFIAAVRPALETGDTARARRAAVLASKYYDPVIACRSVGRLFADRGDPEACRVVNDLIATILERSDLDAREKQAAIRGLYSVAMPPDRSQATEKPGKIHTSAVSFSDYEGEVLLVDFWATWCGPCIREMPNVVAVYDDHREKGFEILGVSLDRAGSEKRLESTMGRLGMTWDQVYEGKGWSSSLARKHGVRSIPTTLLYDRSGKLRYRGLRGPALARAVAELVAERAPDEG